MRRSLMIAIGLALSLAAVPMATLALEVQIDFEAVDVRIARPNSEVVIAGTYTCDTGTTGTIRGVVTQGQRSEAGEIPLVCDDTEQAFEIRLPLGTPPFHPGLATLDIGFSATDGKDGIASGVSREVFIQPR